MVQHCGAPTGVGAEIRGRRGPAVRNKFRGDASLMMVCFVRDIGFEKIFVKIILVSKSKRKFVTLRTVSTIL
jgi:hypothetical protein